MSEWTPGPWSWAKDTEIGREGTLLGKEGVKIFSHAPYENMWFASYGKPQQDTANAHLIAAAPDLYEALEATVYELSEMYRVVADTKAGAQSRIDSEPHLIAARKALAKARGEAQ